MATAILAGTAIPFPELSKQPKKPSVYHAVAAKLAAFGVVAEAETEGPHRPWVRIVIGRYELLMERNFDRWSGIAYSRGTDGCKVVKVSTAIHPKSNAAFA